MDQRTSKGLTSQRWCRQIICEGGRGLTSIEDSVDALIQWLEDYIEKREGKLITATRNNWQHEDQQNEKN